MSTICYTRPKIRQMTNNLNLQLVHLDQSKSSWVLTDFVSQMQPLHSPFVACVTVLLVQSTVFYAHVSNLQTHVPM